MQFQIETTNLILKVENADKSYDVLDFYSYNSDLFDKFEPTRPTNFYTEAFHRASLRAEHNDIINKRFLRYYIYLRSNPQKIIGAINFSSINYGAFMSASIGYKLDKNHHKRGYAYEACVAAIGIMFNDYGLQRIDARVLPSNVPSIKLLKRLHFTYEGIEYSAVSINGNRENLYRFSLINNNYPIQY